MKADPDGLLSEAAGSGDRRHTLEVLRDTLAKSVEAAEPQYVAALARQLTLVMAELDTLAVPKEKSAVDDLASRRADRHAATG